MTRHRSLGPHLTVLQVLRVLDRIDRSIVQGFYAKLLQADTSSRLPKDCDENSIRILEVIDVLSEDNGEVYAHNLKDAIRSLEGDAALDKRPLFQEIIEGALMRLRNGKFI